MTNPKRHHWWPETQSAHWAGADGLIHVIRADGSTFRASPRNVGVEGQLYTRYDEAGERDLAIEKWLASDIEGPFADALRSLVTLETLRSRPIGRSRDLVKETELVDLGFVMNGKLEWLDIQSNHRAALVNYISAMLVRSPRYLKKLRDFHQKNIDMPALHLPEDKVILSLALDNMLHVFKIYREEIAKSEIVFVISDTDKELLFPDTGIAIKEPWQKSGAVPFDAFLPITPSIGVNILPVRQKSSGIIHLSRLSSKGVARYNRNILSDAEKFVFSRSAPPIEFIKRHFGIPAPTPIGHRMVNGGFETKYDRSRDRPL